MLVNQSDPLILSNIVQHIKYRVPHILKVLKYINLLYLFPIQSSHIFSFFVFSRFVFSCFVRLGLGFFGCLVGSQLPCFWAAFRVPTSIYLSASPLSRHPKKKIVQCSFLKLSRTFLKSCGFLLLFEIIKGAVVRVFVQSLQLKICVLFAACNQCNYSRLE
ncbi:hypothetical protein HanXRQr2_Chr11g0509881 [Helianthus annuus]|uniref:Uncharacterized protein n=1 Tax=Helianthus annuus TaxID=4232 RepID=A0A251TCJ7_HELAN|nr:hypothetical protein HanXRQr2_Chr11g0509881 [Helianthus annuus]KAJ0876675.1 hypothetical protein HanPSC8_Chr11g0491171 [Helianthus annuus]